MVLHLVTETGNLYGAIPVAQGFVLPAHTLTQTFSIQQRARASMLRATDKDMEDAVDEELIQEDSGLMIPQSTATTNSLSSLSGPPHTLRYQVPEDPFGRHLVMLIAATLPWYAFTAFEMKCLSLPSTDFFGLSSTVISAMGTYVLLSQFGVYYGCLRLAKATTLGEAQRLVGIMTCLCIPADVIGTLYKPTGSLGVTVVGFAAVTTAFGIFLAHYLRKAAYREIPPSSHHTDSESIWTALQEYRPPPTASSTQLAMEFTRGFVSFTISVSALGTFFAEGHDPNVWIVASLLSVLVHTSIECFLATTFPGVELEEFDSYLLAESALYSIHMVATTIVSHEEGFGDTLVDQILWSWLFGSATGKLIDRMGKLLAKVDFDSKIGLSKFE
jgi:hypothetical protein